MLTKSSKRSDYAKIINDNLPIHGGPGINVSGSTISAVSASMGRAFAWTGKTTDKGPADEADWTDERYWIQRVQLTTNTDDYATANVEAADWTVFPAGGDKASWVTATNLAEASDETHTLPVGVLCMVWSEQDLSGKTKYVMQATPDRFWAKLTAEDGGNAGNYKWLRQNVVDGALADADGSSGDFYSASDINSRQGIAPNTKVLLTYVGTNGGGDPKYMFDAGEGAGDSGFYAKITGSTSIAPNRWSYSWTEQQCALAGVWQDKAGGRTSSGTGVAYNTIEAGNSGSGIQGNGIDVDDLPPGSSIMPASGGTPVVRMYLITDCNAVQEPTFSYENGVSTCST